MSAGPFSCRFRIGHDHPALPGHFPGRPLVPGVVLLDRVLAALGEAFSLEPPARLPRVKFTRPVLPGQDLALEATRDPADLAKVSFRLSHDGQPVASGTVLFADTAAP